MPGDMADSIDTFVADEGLLATDGPLETLWTDASGRTTPIVLMGNDHLVHAHAFAKRTGYGPRLVEALAQEIARRGILLDGDDLPTMPFTHTVPVWKDGAGVLHPIPQMDTQHLLNAHRFARRLVVHGTFALEGAIAALAAEIAHRGLTPLGVDGTTPEDAPGSWLDDDLPF
jgi:GNAT superfamily N-acetyltransferase